MALGVWAVHVSCTVLLRLIDVCFPPSHADWVCVSRDLPAHKATVNQCVTGRWDP